VLKLHIDLFIALSVIKIIKKRNITVIYNNAVIALIFKLKWMIH